VDVSKLYAHAFVMWRATIGNLLLNFLTDIITVAFEAQRIFHFFCIYEVFVLYLEQRIYGLLVYESK